jgi:DNA-binding CsgD family transcriptional regulator
VFQGSSEFSSYVPPAGVQGDEALGQASLEDGPAVDLMFRLFDSTGYGCIVLDCSHNVIALNRAAWQLLRREAGPNDLRNERWISSHLKKIFADQSGQPWAPFCRESRRPLAVFTLAGSAERSLLILIDTDTFLLPKPPTLQRLFGLTSAESRVAAGIATGLSLTDLAHLQRVSRATVRTQLASIFRKTHTRRQAELVALLARVSFLP